MVVGCVVHLPNTHPVIDGVARLKDGQEREWLLLIQVSLSSYVEHRSKAIKLVDKERGEKR